MKCYREKNFCHAVFVEIFNVIFQELIENENQESKTQKSKKVKILRSSHLKIETMF
jgi:hypothetical protein